ncbi:GNAT family acetyltransferase [candidate division LCP-89 bacterium B3_LCP]|uniref:GNAT family acetyltransferase n=1 Tax=candidate division LCP-89 bacterium B3_LCP TaxID=2012998 RepID=A0A532USS4_UNCL8|nr:MAG: GNAT family acetyltransferase [candidate division LCP-89 bacterium B3_LCP]
MDKLHIRPYQSQDEGQVIDLWHRCGLVVPWNDPKKDIDRQLQVNPELFLVGLVNDTIVASVMGGYEGHRGWVHYLAVLPEYQRRGFARDIMEVIENMLKKQGCPKINLQVRTSNMQAVGFYQSIGYKLDDVVSMGKRLEDDEI